MKVNSTQNYLLIALSIVSSGIVLQHEIRGFHNNEWFALDFLVTAGWYFLSMVFGVPTLIYSYLKYKQTKNRFFYTPSIIFGLTILVTITLTISKNIENNSPVILSAHYDGGGNGLSIILRENGGYELHDYSILGGSVISGAYKIHNDTIYLDKNDPIGNGFMHQKLVITPNKILFKINSDGSYENEFFTMKIIKEK